MSPQLQKKEDTTSEALEKTAEVVQQSKELLQKYHEFISELQAVLESPNREA